MKFVDWALFNQYERNGVVDYVKAGLESWEPELTNSKDDFNLLTAIKSVDIIRMTLESGEELDKDELKQMIYNTMAILLILQQKKVTEDEILQEEIVDL